jgi:LysR family nitrogen assimilation transcriptional regulator
LRQLQYLVAIVDAGSMTRAAECLNITPASLSLQMKQLEDSVGARLFLRHSRGVTATDKGAAFFEHAQDILQRVADLERMIVDGGLAAPKTLRVGAVPAVTRMLGIEAISAAAQTLKGTTLLLSEGWSFELLEQLAARTLDFVIAYDLKPDNDIDVVTFFDDEFMFICHPARYPAGQPLKLSEAMASDLVFYGRNSVSWRAVQDTTTAQAVPLPGYMEVQSIAVWRGLLCRGLGTTIAPFASVRNEVLRGELAAHRLVDAPICRSICMAAHHETLALGREIGFVDLISDLMEKIKPAFSIAEGVAD